MKDTSEDTLSMLTCCFSGGGGVPELGLGDAGINCVYTAWKRHIILWENARRFERIADVIQIFLCSSLAAPEPPSEHRLPLLSAPSKLTLGANHRLPPLRRRDWRVDGHSDCAVAHGARHHCMV